MARVLHADKTHSIDEICTSVGVSRATLYRYLNIGADAAGKMPPPLTDPEGNIRDDQGP